MRCFIGAFLTDESAAAVADLVPACPGFRPVPAQNLHVTLRFLGARPVTEALDAARWLTDLAPGAVDCDVLCLTGLPRPWRARVLALELQSTAVLDALQELLSERFGPPDRPFRPHVTVARSRRPRRVETQPLTSDLRVWLRPPRLYRSETLPGGARYSPVAPA